MAVVAQVIGAPAAGPVEPAGAPEAFRGVVPRPAACVGPQDKPELPYPEQLQGQVPWAHRTSGRAAEGYSCNLELVANIDSAVDDLGDAGFANLDSFGECAYYSLGNTAELGAAVIDVSDSANPIRTARLTTPGIGAPWESLRVNNRRGLLAGAANGSPILDVYDVASDCRHPQLLSSTTMPNGKGHEGWFSPDGTTYFMSPVGVYAGNPAGGVTAVDLRDPSAPRELGTWGSAHGGSTSLDGTRAYFCQAEPNAVVTWDTSAIARGEVLDAEPPKLSEFPIPDGVFCQQTYPVFYDGRPHVIQMGELGPGPYFSPPDCTRTDGVANFAPPVIIDMTDERQPALAARLMNEVGDPSNCSRVVADRSTPAGEENDGAQRVYVFQYGTHECTPDRLIDPTILACAEWLSGLRVYDIRDPAQPRELAYFNYGTLRPDLPTVESMAARPIIRPDEGEIWMVGVYTGFSVLRFAEGVYPFPETLQCPSAYDYHFDQYSDACPASRYGITTAERNPVQVDRIAGSGPAGTAVAVSQDAARSRGTVVIGRDDIYADSIAGGPLAAALDAPLLLSSGDRLSAVTAAEIERLGARRAVLLGGEAALSAAVAGDVAALGVEVTRIGGSNRFGTAQRIAAEIGTATGEVFVVEGAHEDPARGWPDALSVAALAAHRRDPVLLVTHGRLPPETVEAINVLGAERVAVVGGEAAVSEDVARELAGATGASLRRIRGATRYATSQAAVAESVAAGMDPSTIWLATGRDWRDAFVAGPAAAARRQPLALLDGHGGTDGIEQLFSTYADRLRRVRLVGGTDAISADVEQRVRELAGARGPTQTQPQGRVASAAPPAATSSFRMRPPTAVDDGLVAEFRLRCVLPVDAEGV